jgi:hypothetical protein
MSYYTGCELKITMPANRAADEPNIRKALLERLPGVSIEFISDPDAKRTYVSEAFVPHSHGMAAMRRQDFESTEMKPVGPETLAGIASDVLDNL